MKSERTIAITGTARGLGRAFAEHYLQRGWGVEGCSRSFSDLDHERYVHTQLDVGDEKAVRRWFSDIRKRRGGLDALVNNAGIARMNHALLTPAETLADILATNVTGTFLCCREAGKLMQQQGGGRIVNLSTVAVPLALAGEAAYAASKAAVENLTRVLAREFAPMKITVNAVGPTPVRTDLVANVPEETLNDLIARQPLARYAEPGDVINVIDFFLAPASDFVTGQVLYLGGV